MFACKDRRTESLARRIRRSGTDPSTLGYGRFVQADPIGVAGGMNLYRYAANDPVNATDPTGLAEQTSFCPAGYAQAKYDSASDIVYCQGFFSGNGGGGGINTQQDCSISGRGGALICPKESPQVEEGDIVVTAKGCGISCQRDAYLRQNSLDRWVFMDGRFNLNPYYERPWWDVGLDGVLAIEITIGSLAAGPGLPSLTARGTGLLNRNNIIRIGYNWRGSAKAGEQVYRIGIGRQWSHIDLLP